jgi:hypothetical protein
MIVLEEEVVDALNERQLLAYIWLLRHAEGDTIKVSVRELSKEWKCSIRTAHRTVKDLENYLTINGGSPTAKMTITIRGQKEGCDTPCDTLSDTLSDTPKALSKHQQTKGFQEGAKNGCDTPCDTPCDTLSDTPKRKKDEEEKGKENTSPTPPIKEKEKEKEENKEKKEKAILTDSLIEREPGGSLSVTTDVPSVNTKAVVEFFNNTIKECGSIMPPVKVIRGLREGYLNARIREFGIEAVYETITKAARSNFLNGGGGHGFIADIDWILRPNNFIKVYEGNYDNRDTANQSSTSYGNNRVIATNQEARIAEHRRQSAAHVARILQASQQNQGEVDNSGLPF